MLSGKYVIMVDADDSYNILEIMPIILDNKEEIVHFVSREDGI